jgi:hypothetical protein
MAPTPEYRLLKWKLALCHRDVEYLAMDRLKTFLSEDLLRDETLVDIFKECGCGDLLSLKEEGFPCVQGTDGFWECGPTTRCSGRSTSQRALRRAQP